MLTLRIAIVSYNYLNFLAKYLAGLELLKFKTGSLRIYWKGRFHMNTIRDFTIRTTV